MHRAEESPADGFGRRPVEARHRNQAKETAMSSVDSTSDDRVANNVMRHEYRTLSDEEKAQMKRVKDLGLEMHQQLESMGSSRQLSIAKTKNEEAVMWAVKHITE